ncbi:Exodeoxyribonuclease V beta chain [Tenacibaculum sp. 190130A14a]|uniref:HEAT repeat domain-containing protein n=1 Tax=Tenacibaculum polynesiense TaxID=3137857 RepID=A0ABP1F064_9FLAO
MKRIIDLNIEYINLKKEKSNIEGGNSEIEKFEEYYLEEVFNFAKKNNYSNHELIQELGKLVVEDKTEWINEYLLIRLIWKVKLNNDFKNKDLLEKLIRKLIAKNDINNAEEYYLESYLDIWNYDLKDLIPLDILESVILIKNQKSIIRYGAFIKAVSYLSDHPEPEQNDVLNKAKKTKLYLEDAYYKEWID